MMLAGADQHVCSGTRLTTICHDTSRCLAHGIDAIDQQFFFSEKLAVKNVVLPEI
jgi:hypothetical protein